MWDILPYITTPITLVALALVIILAIKRARVNYDIQKLKNIDSKDKAGILPLLEDKYAYKTDDLTKEQRYDLAKSQLTDVAKKRRDQLIFSSFLSLVFLIIFIISIRKSDTMEVSSETNNLRPSLLRFNITDSNQTISVVFYSNSLSIKDTIKTPQTITLKDFMHSLIINYYLDEDVKSKNNYPDEVLWKLVHEYKEVSEEDMNKHLSELSWANFDIVSLKYRTLSRQQVEHLEPKRPQKH